MKKVFLFLLLAISFAAQSESLNDISEILKYVESEHIPTAVGDGGNSFGILQIQKNAILDVNREYGTTYRHIDAFNVICSEEIFKLYVKMWVAKLEVKENRKSTTQDIVRIWNGGPKGYKRKSTLKYFVKFKKYRYIRNLTAGNNKATL